MPYYIFSARKSTWICFSIHDDKISHVHVRRISFVLPSTPCLPLCRITSPVQFASMFSFFTLFAFCSPRYAQTHLKETHLCVQRARGTGCAHPAITQCVSPIHQSFIRFVLKSWVSVSKWASRWLMCKRYEAQMGRSGGFWWACMQCADKSERNKSVETSTRCMEVLMWRNNWHAEKKWRKFSWHSHRKINDHIMITLRVCSTISRRNESRGDWEIGWR